jgi:hypothetical protein
MGLFEARRCQNLFVPYARVFLYIYICINLYNYIYTKSIYQKCARYVVNELAQGNMDRPRWSEAFASLEHCEDASSLECLQSVNDLRAILILNQTESGLKSLLPRHLPYEPFDIGGGGQPPRPTSGSLGLRVDLFRTFRGVAVR